MLDARFERNPMATGAPNVRFYAGTPLIDPDGHALGTLCVIDHVPRDLSPFQLDSLGKLGHLAMCHMELRRERDEARSKVRATTTFVANLGQGIRTPISSAARAVDQLAATQLTSVQSELVHRLQLGSDQLLNMLSDVVDYACLDNGQVRLAARPFNLRELVDNTMAAYVDLAAQKRIALRLVWDSSATPNRAGDAGRVAQVLRNLLDNAIRYTARGRVTVTVGDGAAESELRIQVEDTGVGIAPERIRALFHAPALSDIDLHDAHRRAGLGLAIVDQVVHLLGGSCGVSSHLGKGSQFWCSFALPAAGNAPRESTPRGQTQLRDACDLGGRAVLVAVADAVSLMLLLRFLQRHNCEVTVANSGLETTELCRTREFDFVLVDEALPGMSGYAVAAHVRALPGRWNRHMPIIAVTADSSLETRALCANAGMTEHIAKPLSRMKLDSALVRCVVPHGGAHDEPSNMPVARSA